MLLLRTEGDGVRSVGKIVLRLQCLFSGEWKQTVVVGVLG